MGQLQGSRQHVALADAYDDGFAGEPDLVLWTLVGFFLPLGGGHEAGLFAGNVDAGTDSEPQVRHGLVHAPDSEHICQGIEVHIAGSGDGIAHVCVAVAGFLPVAVTVSAARQREPTGARTRVVRVDDAILEACQGHERLDGRAWRVGATQDSVKHGAVEAVGQCAVVAVGNTAREQVRVKTWRGGEHQHIASHRVHGYHGPAPAGQGLLCHGLQLCIEGNGEVAAGTGALMLYRHLRATHPLHTAAFRIYQQLSVARLTVQQIFESRFHTHLAHDGSAGIGIAVNLL